jgi:hypothetical protein
MAFLFAVALKPLTNFTACVNPIDASGDCVIISVIILGVVSTIGGGRSKIPFVKTIEILAQPHKLH